MAAPPIVSNEIQLPDGRIGVPIYIQSTRSQPVILKCHVITIRICAIIQIVMGFFQQSAYVWNLFGGILSTSFGLLSIITGIIGLVFSFFVHSPRLNGTYMGFSITTAAYAFAHAVIMLLIGVYGPGISALVCMGISITASIFCCKTNICCQSYQGNAPSLPMQYSYELPPDRSNEAPPNFQAVFVDHNVNNDKSEPPPRYEE